MIIPAGYKETLWSRDCGSQFLRWKKYKCKIKWHLCLRFVYVKETCWVRWPERGTSVIKIPSYKHRSFHVQLLKLPWDYNSHSCLPFNRKWSLWVWFLHWRWRSWWGNWLGEMTDKLGLQGFGFCVESWDPVLVAVSIGAQWTHIDIGWSSRLANAELNPNL